MLCDLGTDNVLVCEHQANGTFKISSILKMPPGSGPRHMALHDNGKWGYVLNELTSTLTTLLKTDSGWGRR